MASTTVTLSPSSPQLRLALRCRNSVEPRALLVGAWTTNLDSHRRLRLLSLTRSRSQRLERRHNGAFRIVADSTAGAGADAFSGWSDSEHVEDSVDSRRSGWFGGIIRAGSVGLVLVAGLSFAAVSIGNQSTATKQQLEPLTALQEVLLASDNETDKSEENESKKALDGMPIGTGLTPISPKLPESEVAGGPIFAPSLRKSESNLDIGSPEATSETKENLFNVKETIDTNLSDPINLDNDIDEGKLGSQGKENCNTSVDSSSSSSLTNEAVTLNFSVSSKFEPILEPHFLPIDNVKTIESFPSEGNLEVNNLNESMPSEITSMSAPAHPQDEQKEIDYKEINDSKPVLESPIPRSSFSPAGIPAPSVVSAALQVHPGKVLIPAVVDQVQGQALAALQVLKVIEADAQPSGLCTRREYARWLVSASGVLSRNSVSKVYPAMYIENVTELAFDDITPEDPDFSSIQVVNGVGYSGLAEAGLISSTLSNKDLLNDDLGPFYFSPESPLSRQDLVSWKMALEKRQLPEADKKILYQISGFIDIAKINPDAWPAVVADVSAGEQGIIALAFAQVAVALATGEAFDLVNEELARIEAESMAEKAVSAHNALVAEVEKDVNASFEKELLIEKEKIDAVEKMAEETMHELERLRAEREAQNMALMKDRAAIDSEMEVLSRLRREVEEQLESLMNNKVEISYEKEVINKLRKETEDESQEVVRLQHELEVERKALSMARAWAEDEAKRAREQAKALEEARDRWERQGIKVVVDKDLQEETIAEVTWVNVGKKVEDEVEGTVTRSEALVKKLKALASEVKGKTREFIGKIIQKIQYFISMLKEWASIASAKAGVLKDRAALSTRGSVQELQQSTAGFSLALKEGAKRVAGDCREGVGKLTQRFRT
ncbi:hypothetical protein GOBAR_AA36268 [Gossypium barbadense]|uniref:SLH domain-containing protein n=1 Tax=Gossypium barbadense TaxID=3634 RepID=A0A2P5W033_GOSBA|nr:hypothetical protein GOBAR_AA36268 [Gossypium barbadense]